MDIHTCYGIMKKIVNSWPPKMAKVQVSKSMDFHISFLNSDGSPMGPKVILTPKDEKDYEVKTCAGFSQEQIDLFNEAPTYWYRLMRVYRSILLTNHEIKKDKDE